MSLASVVELVALTRCGHASLAVCSPLCGRGLGMASALAYLSSTGTPS